MSETVIGSVKVGIGCLVRCKDFGRSWCGQMMVEVGGVLGFSEAMEIGLLGRGEMILEVGGGKRVSGVLRCRR